ncbi:TPR-like protein [Rhizophagus irregularis]|uniref:TPR-like protein n=1 Tax=Rhizophagus irregularis TaxID=588596 RepID=A0A2I1GUR1_9GLOM|nr:TPR-like protein [Rhizophagus irregularis]
MEGNSNQSGSSSNSSAELRTLLLENISNNSILPELGQDGFITPDRKAEELIIKDLTKMENLVALKLLFENPLNQFSPGILRNSLVTLADPTLFDYYDELSVTRLELHIRTWVAVLEKICFTPMRLSKELRDKVYNSLAKFAEIHKKTTQVMQEGIGNNYRSDFNQFNQLQDNKEDNGIINKRNYNIDFLLIHLRDTLHSLRDDETWFQEIIRRTKELLKAALNITPGVLSTLAPGVPLPNDNCSILSMLTQLRKGLNFKYPVASYYVDWRILLIIQHNLFNWSGGTENIISEKFQEMVLMEYYWSYLEKEWSDVAILNSQSKFDEISNKLAKVLKNTGNFINDLAGNEPLALPHTLCNSTIDSSEKFRNLLKFVKNKFSDDFNLLNYNIERGKGKGKEKSPPIQNTNLTKNISKLGEILEMIANEMTCPIDHEPTDQLCVLKCQHMLSINSLKKLKQNNCPKCREKIQDNDIRYLPQNVIYKHLYSQFFEAGHILPSIEKEDSTNNQYDSDSGDSEIDLMLTKKKRILKAIKLNPNISLKSIFQIGRKQHPKYLSAIKELKEKNYKNAEHWCKLFLKTFPKSYSIRCILAYTYRCLNNYEQAHFYLNEAIELKGKKPNAWYIRGEIHLRQGNYNDAVRDLIASINYNAKITYLYMMIAISYYNNNNNEDALKYFDIALQNDPNNHLCLKYCAYIYEKQEKFSDTLKMLGKLLSINEKDSLILCYYGEISSKIEKYDDAITYFTKANNIDPENVHNLTKRAIIYYILQEYDKALLDFNNIIQLDTSNILAYYYKGLIEDNRSSMLTFKKCIELDPNNNDLEKMYLKNSSNYLPQISNIDYNLKCLPNYHHLIAKINEFANINHDESLLLTRCKIYIELKKYENAVLDLDRLFELNDDISFVYSLQKYSDFWLYLHESYALNELGIINNFDLYMYSVKGVYFMSNLMNLNYNCQFQGSNLNRRTLSLKDNYCLSLPQFPVFFRNVTKSRCYDIIWKINIKKIISSNGFIRFRVDNNSIAANREYTLKHKDILKLEGLGWISYVSFHSIYLTDHNHIQLSIETNNSIDMQVEYVRTTKDYHNERIYFSKMDYFLPPYTNNIPETFKDKYFLRKETENLLELKDIIDY